MSSRVTTAEERAKTNPLQFYRTPPWATWRLIIHAQHKLRGARVLELGAGDGYIAREVLSCTALQVTEYVAVELDPGRAQLCREAIEPLGGTVVEANVFDLTPEVVGLFDVVIMNPPFDYAVGFLHIARKLLQPGAPIYMLQRCTFPNEVKTERDRLFDIENPDTNPVGFDLGYAGKLTLTNRCDFRGDGASDSINHSWFEFFPGTATMAKCRQYEIRRRREPCRWDPSRDPELPRQSWAEDEVQQSLF